MIQDLGFGLDCTDQRRHQRFGRADDHLRATAERRAHLRGAVMGFRVLGLKGLGFRVYQWPKRPAFFKRDYI